MDFYLKKMKGNVYLPFADSDFETSAKVPVDSMVKCEFIKTRNYLFHKKFFQLLNLTLQNLPEQFSRIKTVENILTEIKLRTGHYEIIVLTDGRPYYRPESISFEKMDQDEFEEFYSRALDIILKHFLPGVTEKFVNDNLINFF